MNDLEKKLHEEFCKLGSQNRLLIYKLQQLLPEIEKRKIHLKAGFPSVYAYAQEIAGMSKSAIDASLRIAKHLEDKPMLKLAIEKVGASKISMISKIATRETDNFWADKAQNMSRRSLEQLARDERAFQQSEGKSLFGTAQAQKHIAYSASPKIKIELDNDMQIIFLRLKKRFGNISNKEVLQRILTIAETAGENFTGKKILRNKRTFSFKKNTQQAQSHGTEKFSQHPQAQTLEKFSQHPQSYIPKKISRTLKKSDKEKLGLICGYLGCNRPIEEIHHPRRFAQNPKHKDLVGLCKIHHEYMHNGIIANERAAPENWLYASKNIPENIIDFLYRKHKTARAFPLRI